MKDFLKEQLERVNYWLTFAEAKNGGLIAINIAIVAVTIQIKAFSLSLTAIICCLFLISSIISLLSFYSNLRNKIKSPKKKIGNIDELNLLFYKDVAQINNSDIYLRLLEKRYNLAIEEKNSLIYRDFIVEIIVNSEIAVYKFNMFNKAMLVDVFSVCVFIIGFIIA